MTIKELHKLLSDMMKAHPKCADLLVRLDINGDDYDPIANYWLYEFELHSTGQSGYEVEGELLLMGEQ